MRRLLRNKNPQETWKGLDMPINTLNNRTVTGQNTGSNNFAAFQTQLANIKAQQPKTALSNVFTQAKTTNKNIQGAGRNAQNATDNIRNTWSDENIDKGFKATHDNRNNQFKGISDTFNTGTDAVEARKTVSFAGSPSDEVIKRLINRSTTSGSGGMNAAKSLGDKQIIADDLADDGILNSPESDKILRNIFGENYAFEDMARAELSKISEQIGEGITRNMTPGGSNPAPAASSSSSGGLALAENTPSSPLYNDPRNWGALTQQWMQDINSDNASIRATALENLTKLSDYGILDDIIKQDTFGDRNTIGTREADAYQNALALEQANPSNLGNAYGLLGGRDSGNAYMNALNMETARPDILNAIGENQGIRGERALAEEEFRTGQKTYMDTVREREQAYRTKADAMKMDIDKDKSSTVAAIEEKYKKLGYTPEQIKEKVATMTGNQTSVNQNEADRVANEKAYSDYMEKIKGAKTESDKKIASNKLKAINTEFVQKTNMPPETKHDLEEYIAATTPEGDPEPTLEQAQSTLENLTDEALATYVKNYGEAAAKVADIGQILGALAMIPGFPIAAITGISGIGGTIASKILAGKANKYKAEIKRREEEAAALKKYNDEIAKKKAEDDAKLAAAAQRRQQDLDNSSGDGDSLFEGEDKPSKKTGGVSKGTNAVIIPGVTAGWDNGSYA